jgi:hypothetical protein
VLLLWASVYIAFLFFRMPQNTSYRLFYLPPLIVIPATAISETAALPMAAFLFVALLLLWNFTFVIYPQAQAGFNTALRFALAQRDRWPPGTRIVFRV